ncbi:MAG TPA: signal peptidase I [Candidatus Saccharimonadales bacterium]|nr:signal peptidase I [Candidatus Saccharimonadales bacterium]
MLLRLARHSLNALALTAALAVGLSAVWLHAHGGQLLSVQTGSMTPIIDKGDMVVVTRVPARQLAVGDVVTYASPTNPHKTITHRIIRITSQQITTKGDANAVADPTFNASSVIGRVRAHVRYAGRALDFARRPVGLLILIYVPALSILFSEMRRLSAAYKKERPYFAPGMEARLRARRAPPNYRAMATKACVALAVVVSFGLAQPVQAALHSTAMLPGNTILTAKLHKQGCDSSNTTITVNNSTSQTASSGSASGPSATSGSAANNSSTSTSITITNC